MVEIIEEEALIFEKEEEEVKVEKMLQKTKINQSTHHKEEEVVISKEDALISMDVAISNVFVVTSLVINQINIGIIQSIKKILAIFITKRKIILKLYFLLAMGIKQCLVFR